MGKKTRPEAKDVGPDSGVPIVRRSTKRTFHVMREGTKYYVGVRVGEGRIAPHSDIRWEDFDECAAFVAKLSGEKSREEREAEERAAKRARDPGMARLLSRLSEGE